MVELHHERVAGAAPTRWLVLTHGIFGAGGNWRRIARRLTERRPERGVVLVDLRGHGRSPAGEPPHTLAACADDIAGLVTRLRGEGLVVDALAGHSFGGKVVLAARAVVAPAQTWMLDSNPRARPPASVDVGDGALAVLALMATLPPSLPDRATFERRIVDAGQTPALAQWLALSLVAADGGGVRLRFDLAALRAMLASYLEADLWPALVGDDAPGEAHVVIAGRSTTIGDDAGAILAAGPRVFGHVLADAGHWLHVDAPEAVIELLASALP